MKDLYVDGAVPLRRCISGPPCTGTYPDPVIKACIGSHFLQHTRASIKAALAGRLYVCKCGNGGAPDVMTTGHAAVFVCGVCSARTCMLCNQPAHGTTECGAAAAAGVTLNEAMTAAVVRTCTCGNRFVKTEGCNHMSCVCGRHSCYLCEATISGYAHFCRCGHKETCTKCHVYSDPERWNEQRLKTAIGLL